MANEQQLLARLVGLRRECQVVETKLAKRWPAIIAGLLKSRGLSLRSFAAKIGMSPAYLSEVGTGKKSPSPKLEELLRTEMVAQ